MESLEKTENFLENNNITYEEGYHSKRHNTHFNEDYYLARAKISLLKFFLKIDKKSKILDFGCGLGQNIFFLKNAMGYDISEYGVQFCKKKGINATNNLNDIENESFDIVFSAHVLEHHPHPKTMIEDIRKKLAKNKKLILVIPYERHGKGNFHLDLNQHLYCWNFQTINNLLINCGFEIKENKYLRGAGYNRLLFLSKINLKLYKFVTDLASYIFGIKEIMVVAVKK